MLAESVMSSGMLRGTQQLQVFQPVVSSIPVDVVDYFPRRKHPPKVLGHNEAMLRHPLTFAGHRVIWLEKVDVSLPDAPLFIKCPMAPAPLPGAIGPNGSNGNAALLQRLKYGRVRNTKLGGDIRARESAKVQVTQYFNGWQLARRGFQRALTEAILSVTPRRAKAPQRPLGVEFLMAELAGF
jgi:hypothetical protein